MRQPVHEKRERETNSDRERRLKKRTRTRISTGLATVTLDDVAAAADVSAATVSRAINRPDLVKPAVRVRVEAAIAKLGYVPNGAARALVSKRTKALGAVVPTLNNTIFSDTINAFQHRLDELGYVMFLTSAEYDSERELRRAKTLVERGIDGLMLVGYRHDSALYSFLRERKIPFVNTWAAQADSPYPAIGYNGKLGGEMVINYLLSLGHRSFGIVMGDPAKNDRMEARMIGIRAALDRAGIELRPEQIVFSNYSVDAGRHGCAELFARGLKPTAIIGGNDILGLGILFECQHRGINVPGEISIMGFGDANIAAHVLPPMSTVRTPSAEMGLRAAEYLVAVAEGHEAVLPPPQDLLLIPRGTTGPAPKQIFAAGEKPAAAPKAKSKLRTAET
jgi:LacI family transcriptional regulator